MNWYHSSDLALIITETKYLLLFSITKINDYNKNIFVSIAGGIKLALI